MFSLLDKLFRREPRKPPQVRRRIDLGEAQPLYTIYAIGDVHGRLDLLTAAEQRIAADIATRGKAGLVLLLGDYVDRGPQSAAVLDYLCSQPGGGMRRLSLCGNHDDAFLQFIRAPEQQLQWLDFGGRQTLMSYGIDAEHLLARGNGGMPALKASMQQAIPPEHIRFLEELPVYARIGGHLFVHAGIRPGSALEEQTDEDLMWIREPFLSSGPGLPLTVVHGHTPVDAPETGPGRIGIDTGAVFTGRLTVLRVDAGEMAVLQES